MISDVITFELLFKLVLFIYIVDYLLSAAFKVIWAFINAVSDRILRRKGFNTNGDYEPMVDYIPFHVLITGSWSVGPEKIKRSNF